MLYKPEAFEQLTDEPWDETRVRTAIRAIVADTDQAFDAERLWPAGEWESWKTPLPLTSLYVGASGVVWALDALRRRGLAETSLDLAAAALRTLEAWREQPDFMRDIELPAQKESAFLTGESGPLFVACRLAPSRELSDDLFAHVRENVDNEAIEIMWGAPGTMLAARAMLDWNGDERWADAWRESADAVWRSREPDGLWTKRLDGHTNRGLGPPHGVVGNVLALLGGGDLLDAIGEGLSSGRRPPCSLGTRCSRTALPTGRCSTAPASSIPTTARSASSGALAHRASSSRPPRTSTRSCCSQAPSSHGGPGRRAW
jgi:hypothetical protein